MVLRQLRWLSVAVTGLLLTGAAVAPAVARADTAPVPPAPPTVAADALPTTQVDGVVYAQTVVGNTVYAGGRFTKARPAGAAPGVGTVTRNNLLAYDIRTGQLVSSFAPDLNGQVLAVAGSPDGSRVYVAGEFTRANGANRYRIAAYSTATGALISTFAPVLDYRARALVVTADAVYVGGAFSSANGNARTRLAAFAPSTGALLAWAPSADEQVMAMVQTPDRTRIVVAGQFATLSGAPANSMGALDATTGAVRTWKGNDLIRNAGTASALTSLSTDGTKIYATGYVFGGGGRLEGTVALNPADGSVVWVEDCHGDTYSGFAVGGAYYTVGHIHYCGNVGGYRETKPRSYSYALAFGTQPTGTVSKNNEGNYFNFGGQPAPSLLTWFPRLDAGTFTGQGQAGWSITGNASFVVVGGEFPKAGGVNQQGLVRYAVRSAAPNKIGPEVAGAALNPAVVELSDAVRLSWPADWDRDNEQLTYRLVRDSDDANPIYQATQRSTFWNRPQMGFVDTTAQPGTTHRYRLFVTDPLGNTAASETVTGSPAGSGAVGYAQGVRGDGANLYWRFGEASGTTAVDSVGVRDGQLQPGVVRGGPSAVRDPADRSVRTNGTSTGLVSAFDQQPAPTTFTAESWFRTSTTSGGKLLGYGNSRTGTSGSYDRHVYMNDAGQLSFGVYTGAGAVTVQSRESYNDGGWHHVAATLDAGRMVLYVDGVAVGQRSAVGWPSAYAGYWSVGGDSLGGWPDRPSSSFFAGDLDEFAAYPTALAAARVEEHYLRGAGAGPAPNQPPVASFTSSAQELAVAFDASGSSDPEGTALSYAWAFGDGASGAGKTVSHTYAAAGTYAVKLTVTDAAVAATAVTRQVTVSTAPAPNQPPVASFTSSAQDLAAAFDASGSSDPEGTALSYAWAFGDGASGAGKTVSHTYAAAGTYAVKLTVTDAADAATAVTKQVTVTAAPAAVVVANDAFSRSVSGGFGRADAGGSWLVSGGASNFAVSGGAGRMRMATPGSGPATWLDALDAADSDTRVALSVDKAATGGGTFLTLVSRRASSADNYRFKLRFLATGDVQAALLRRTNNAETTLTQVTLPQAYVPGQLLNLRLRVTGAAPTTLSAKVWPAGQTEPDAWLLTSTDDTPALQGTGSVALDSYLSGSATNAPVTASWDDLSVTKP